MAEPEYMCECCSRYIRESEILFNPSGAIICQECMQDEHLYKPSRVCANCGNELEENKCNYCGYVNG